LKHHRAPVSLFKPKGGHYHHLYMFQWWSFGEKR
jgi:hypothetical protein